MSRKPDLIVPDRRQRKRYLTLKNFRNAVILFVVVFAVITIRSELRRPDGTGYGRLVEHELAPPVQAQPVPVVQAETASVPDQTHPDPMLVEPLVREQWIRPEEEDPQIVTSFGGTRAEASVATGDTRVAIVGGTDGVAIVQQERRKPQLLGGFGRQ